MNTQRRNVVVIFCDQLRKDYLHAYGADFIPTPNLDALAAAGMVCDNAITAATVCAPARAACITGMPVSAHGAWTNQVPIRQDLDCLPDRLREAGYKTAAIGCYDHDYFGDHCDYHIKFSSGKGDYLDYLKERHPEADRGFMGGDHQFLYTEEEHYDRWSCDRMVDYLKEQDGETPFFAYCGFLMPHGPYMPPQEMKGVIDPEQIPEPWILDREDIPAVEKYRRAYLTPIAAMQDPVAAMEEYKKDRLAYCEMIAAVDGLVGRIVGTLKEQGLYENTTIIFSCDHGSMEHDYNLTEKGPYPYTQQLFIPLIIANHPEVQPGSRTDVLCGNRDIGGTILDIAGDPRQLGLARSIIGMAVGRVPERSVNLSEFCDSCKNLVDKRYTFSYYPFTKTYTLFDRIEDPRLTKNLAKDPAYMEIAQNFLMRTIDYMILSKGVRIEAKDLAPEVREGIEEMYPQFLDNFTICYPLMTQEMVDRVREAGLDADYNEFCRTREITAHYGVYWRNS